MRRQGRLTNWNDEKGFGFITPAAGGSRVFVHISAFPRGQRRPVVNDRLTYRTSRDTRKRVRAESVSYRDRSARAAGRSRGVVPALGVASLFLAVLSAAALADAVPPVVVGFYILLGILSFFMYAVDKSAAERGNRRIAEAVRHWVDALGGWPGALVARHMLRHKTSKKSFRLVFWCTVIANCSGLVWLLYSGQAADIRAAIGLG